jgi:hypothetical protein
MLSPGVMEVLGWLSHGPTFNSSKPGDAGDLEAGAEVELAGDVIDLRGFRAAEVADDASVIARGTGFDLNADGGAFQASFQHFLHLAGEVEGAFVINGDVRVAADAEAGGGGDFFGGKELADEEGDDVLKVHIEVLAALGVGHDDMAWQVGRERQQDVAFLRAAVVPAGHGADEDDVQRRDGRAGAGVIDDDG